MLKFKEEFLQIVDSLKNGEDLNLEKFKNALAETIKFSEKLKDKILHATPEEREEMKEFLFEMQTKMEAEKANLFQNIGISEEDLKAFISNKDNFSDPEWNAIQDMKGYIQENVETAVNKSKKVNKSKTKWLQS